MVIEPVEGDGGSVFCLRQEMYYAFSIAKRHVCCSRRDRSRSDIRAYVKLALTLVMNSCRKHYGQYLIKLANGLRIRNVHDVN